MTWPFRWAVLAVTWGLSRALFEKIGAHRWGLDLEFLADLAVLSLLQSIAVRPFLRPSASGPVGLSLRLLVPLFPLHLVVTAGVAYLFGHVDLRPHTVTGLLALPLLQGAVLASLLPWPAPAPPDAPFPRARRLEAALSLSLLVLVAAVAADAASGWYGPALARVLPRWPAPLRGLAGYSLPALTALGLTLALRARLASERIVASLLDAAAATFLATLVGAFGQYYQRPFLVRPWSTLLPAGLWLSALAALAALTLAAAAERRERR